jgi:hypothetical protein
VRRHSNYTGTRYDSWHTDCGGGGASGRSALGIQEFSALDEQLKKTGYVLSSMVHPENHYDELAAIARSQGKTFVGLLQLEKSAMASRTKGAQATLAEKAAGESAEGAAKAAAAGGGVGAGSAQAALLATSLGETEARLLRLRNATAALGNGLSAQAEKGMAALVLKLRLQHAQLMDAAMRAGPASAMMPVGQRLTPKKLAAIATGQQQVESALDAIERKVALAKQAQIEKQLKQVLAGEKKLHGTSVLGQALGNRLKVQLARTRTALEDMANAMVDGSPAPSSSSAGSGAGGGASGGGKAAVASKLKMIAAAQGKLGTALTKMAGFSMTATSIPATAPTSTSTSTSTGTRRLGGRRMPYGANGSANRSAVHRSGDRSTGDGTAAAVVAKRRWSASAVKEATQLLEEVTELLRRTTATHHQLSQLRAGMQEAGGGDSDKDTDTGASSDTDSYTADEVGASAAFELLPGFAAFADADADADDDADADADAIAAADAGAAAEEAQRGAALVLSKINTLEELETHTQQRREEREVSRKERPEEQHEKQDQAVQAHHEDDEDDEDGEDDYYFPEDDDGAADPDPHGQLAAQQLQRRRAAIARRLGESGSGGGEKPRGLFYHLGSVSAQTAEAPTTPPKAKAGGSAGGGAGGGAGGDGGSVHIKNTHGMFMNDGKAHDRSVKGLLRVKTAELRKRLFRVQSLIEQSGKSDLGTRSFAALDKQLASNDEELHAMTNPATHYDRLAQIGKSQGRLYNALLQLEVGV